MAETPTTSLDFRCGCPDCAKRTAVLPKSLPAIGDDLDWLLRDYDGLRLFMMEELAARFPERLRWNPADLEVVIVEALAAVLDVLSDKADRVAAEAMLETARRPESVRRLLSFIGYDALQAAYGRGDITTNPDADNTAAVAELDTLWRRSPLLMEEARLAGPRAIATNYRMVTVDDHAQQLEDHPLVLRASAKLKWTGSWGTVFVTVVAWNNHALDEFNLAFPQDIRDAIDALHREQSLDPVVWEASPTIRTIVTPYIDSRRMAGREVLLLDAVLVPVTISVSVRVASNYFRSEIRSAVEEALGTGPGGFFEPGRLRFGEDLHASDLVEVLMALDGVEHVCLNRFKRLGSQYPDRADVGSIPLDGLEIAVCDNDPTNLARGYWRLVLHGGMPG